MHSNDRKSFSVAICTTDHTAVVVLCLWLGKWVVTGFEVIKCHPIFTTQGDRVPPPPSPNTTGVWNNVDTHSVTKGEGGCGSASLP